MTAARQDGKSFWDIDTGGDPAKLEMLTDTAIKNVIVIMQKAVVHLVNTKDTQRLQALQACTQRLYKRASECLREGKTMKVSNSIDKGLH